MVELQPSKLITRVRFPPPASLSFRAQHELDERVERAVGSAPVRYVARPGGYSTADRFSVELADGRRVFVKSAEDANLAGWLRREHEVYASVEGGFIPRLEGWDDDGTRPVLAIEDLSDADWVPRWDATRVGAVILALEEISRRAQRQHLLPRLGCDLRRLELGDLRQSSARPRGWLPSLACEGGPKRGKLVG